MKSLIFLLSIFFLTTAHAKLCEVYGISDGPQKLSCVFPSLNLKLNCKDGTYFLNHSLVSAAYHLEVEDGPVPLVFESKDFELTVLIEDKNNITADLVQNQKKFKGSCL